jgi:hypothetical protein
MRFVIIMFFSAGVLDTVLHFVKTHFYHLKTQLKVIIILKFRNVGTLHREDLGRCLSFANQSLSFNSRTLLFSLRQKFK